jgi:large subunit ribosomal protein L32
VRTRRAHHALDAIGTDTCKNCKAITLPHIACKACGFYKGRFVKQTKARA